MELLPLERLGVHEMQPGVVTFGAVFPGIRPPARIMVRILHHAEQFLQDSLPYDYDLQYQPQGVPGLRYPDYWSVTLDMKSIAPRKRGSKWGRDGRYVYRYWIVPEHGEPVDWVSDPFGREFGGGAMSAFTLGYRPYEWDDAEADWKTPHLRDLVIYELMLSEFAGNLQGAMRQLPYLADLGVNCIEVMPVSNAARTIDWGFLPTGYFGVDERFGTRTDMHRFIEAAHAKKIAVILDSVYGHTDARFPYEYLYSRLSIPNPMMGGQAMWGSSTDWSREFTRDFFYSVNHFWLDRFHVDGFRYDCVPDYWDGARGMGFANLVYHTYQLARSRRERQHWDRFRGTDGTFNLIQCAEYLDNPRRILRETYSNCAWQNETLGVAQRLTREPALAEKFGKRLGVLKDEEDAEDYPTELERIEKVPLQYIENHDHSRFICNFTELAPHDIFSEGDRGRWQKLRPYLIALLTANGVPLLWQGEELCENYWLPEEGVARPWHLRPVRWSYAYDEPGRAILGLVRKLLAIRRDREEMRRGEYRLSRGHPPGVLICSRVLPASESIVMINVTDQPVPVSFTFPQPGLWRDRLEKEAKEVETYAPTRVTIPANDGYIWTR